MRGWEMVVCMAVAAVLLVLGTLRLARKKRAKGPQLVVRRPQHSQERVTDARGRGVSHTRSMGRSAGRGPRVVR